MIVLKMYGIEGLVIQVIKMEPCKKCGEKANVIIDGDGFMVTVLIRCKKCGRRLVKWFIEDGKPESVNQGVAIAVQEWNSGKVDSNV